MSLFPTVVEVGFGSEGGVMRCLADGFVVVFRKKYATGSSVTKTASGGEEIVVQGDNSDDIFDWVVDVGGVPEDNVECIEDKKKKSAG